MSRAHHPAQAAADRQQAEADRRALHDWARAERAIARKETAKSVLCWTLALSVCVLTYVGVGALVAWAS